MKKFKLKKDTDFHKSLPNLTNTDDDESELRQEPINRLNGTTKGFGYSGSVLSLDENGSLLEGTIPLQILLPNRTVPVKMNAEAKTPMMDLLVQVTTSNGINPGGMYLKIPTDRPPGYLHYKPNTPIGTLNCDGTLEIVPKFDLCERPRKQTPKKANLPFEVREMHKIDLQNFPSCHKTVSKPTIRIQVDLPKNQKSVFRLSPQLTLNEVHRRVCQDTKYNINSYELRTSQCPGLDLDDLNVKLGDSGTVHFVLVSTKANNLSKSTGDLFGLYSKMPIEEKEKQKSRGLFWFLRRKKRKGPQTGTGKGSNPNLSVDHNSDSLHRDKRSKPTPQVRPLSLQFEKNGLIDYDDDEDAPAGSEIYETKLWLKNAEKKRIAPKPPVVETTVQTKLIQPPLSSYDVNNANDSVVGDGSKKNNHQQRERRYSDSTSSGYHEDSSAQSPSPELVIPSSSIALDKHRTVATEDSYGVVERSVSEKSGSSGQSSTAFNRTNLIESRTPIDDGDQFDHQRMINTSLVGAASVTKTVVDEGDSRRKFRAPPPPPAYVETQRQPLFLHFLEHRDGGLLIEPGLMTEDKYRTSNHTSRSSSPATVEEVDQNFKDVIQHMEAEISADALRETRLGRPDQIKVISLHHDYSDNDVYSLPNENYEFVLSSTNGVSKILIDPIENFDNSDVDDDKLIAVKHLNSSVGTSGTDKGMNENLTPSVNLPSTIRSELPEDVQIRSIKIDSSTYADAWAESGKPLVNLQAKNVLDLNVVPDEPIQIESQWTDRGLKESWVPSVPLPIKICSEVNVEPIERQIEPKQVLLGRSSRTSLTPAESWTDKGLNETWMPSVPLPAKISSEIFEEQVEREIKTTQVERLLTTAEHSTSCTDNGLSEPLTPSVHLPAKISSELILEPVVEPPIKPRRVDTGRNYKQTLFTTVEPSTAWTDAGLTETWMPSVPLPARIWYESEPVERIIVPKQIENVQSLRTSLLGEDQAQIKIEPERNWSLAKVGTCTPFTDKGLNENWSPSVELPAKICSEINVVEREQREIDKPIDVEPVPIVFHENKQVTRRELQPVVTHLNDDLEPKRPIVIGYDEQIEQEKRPSLPKTEPPKDTEMKQKRDPLDVDEWYTIRSEKPSTKQYTTIDAQVGRPNEHGLNEKWEPSVPVVIDLEPTRDDVVHRYEFDESKNSPKPSPRSISSLSSLDSPLKLSIVDMSENNSSNVSSPKFLRDYKDSPRMNNTMSPRPYQPLSPQSRISFTDPKRNYYPSMTVKNFEDEYYAKEMNDEYMRTMKYGYVDPEERKENTSTSSSISSPSSQNLKPVTPISHQERRKTTEISVKVNSPTYETSQKQIQHKTYPATPVVAVAGDEEVLLYQEYEKLQVMFSQWQERLKHNESVVKRGGKLSALEILEFQRSEAALMKQHQLVEKLCPEVKSETSNVNDVSPRSIKKELVNYQNHSNHESHEERKFVDSSSQNGAQHRFSPPNAKEDENYRKRTVDVIRSTRVPQGGENDDYREILPSQNLLIDSELNNSSIDTSSTLKPTQLFAAKKRFEKSADEPRPVTYRAENEISSDLYQNGQNGGDYGYGYGNLVSKTIFITNPSSATPSRRTNEKNQPVGLYVSKVNLPQYEVENVENLSSAIYYDVQIRENRSTTGPIMEPKRDHRSTYFIPPPPVPTFNSVSMTSLTVNQDGSFVTDDDPNTKDTLLRSIREFGSSGHLKHI